MRGNALDLDLGPQHADPAEQQAEIGRLEQQDGIGQHARGAGRQRPVAGALLLDHAEEGELAVQRAGQRLGERRTASSARGAARLSCRRRRGPNSQPPERAGMNGSDDQSAASAGHDVDVPVQQQRRGQPGFIRPSTFRRPGVRRLRHAAGCSGAVSAGNSSRLTSNPSPSSSAAMSSCAPRSRADGARLGDQSLQEGESAFRARLDGRVHRLPAGGRRGGHRGPPWSRV